MNKLDDLGTYDSDTVHDMYVDYEYQTNTDKDIDTFVDNLDDWD